MITLLVRGCAVGCHTQQAVHFLRMEGEYFVVALHYTDGVHRVRATDIEGVEFSGLSGKFKHTITFHIERLNTVVS